MFVSKHRLNNIVRDQLNFLLEDTDSAFDIALKLMTDLEPKRLDRMVELAKEKRQLDGNLSKLKHSVEGEPETKQDTEIGDFER